MGIILLVVVLVLAMKKVLLHKNLKIATLRPILHKIGTICTLSFSCAEKGYDKLFFLKML